MNIPVKYLKWFGIVGLVIIILGGIFISTGINPRYLIAGENVNKTVTVSEVSPEPSQTISETPQDATDSPQSDYADNGSQTTQPTVTSDPTVSCSIDHIGTQQMSQSQCSASFACQIGDSWVLYTDKDKCTADQKTYYQELYGYTSTSTDDNTSAPVAYPTVDTSGQKSVADCIKDAQTMYQQTEQEYENTYKRSGVDPSAVNIGTDGDAANQEAQAIYACQH